MCCDGEDRGRTERPCFPLHCSLVSPRTFKAQPSVRGADLTWGMEEWHLLSWRASRPCFRGRHAVAQPQHTPPDPLSLPPAAAHVGDWCAWLTLWMSRSFSHAPAASSSAPAPGRKRMGFHSASLHLTAPPTHPSSILSGLRPPLMLQGSQGHMGLCWCRNRVGDAHMPYASREGCGAVCMWECPRVLLTTAQV